MRVRDAVAHAAVQQALPVHIYGAVHKRHGRAGYQIALPVLEIQIPHVVAEVVGPAGCQIGGNGGQLDGRFREPIHAQMLYLVRDGVENEVRSHVVAGEQLRAQRHEPPVVAIFQIAIRHAPHRTACIIEAADGTRRRAHNGLREHPLVHEVIHHAAREQVTHGAAFQHHLERDKPLPFPKRTACRFGLAHC